MVLSTCLPTRTLISSVRTTSQSGLRILPSPPTFLPSSILPPSLQSSSVTDIAIDDPSFPPTLHPSSLEIEVTGVINLEDTEMVGNLEVTDENFEDIQIVVQDR